MADGEADWENEDFEPVLKKPILHTDRWEGEDEEEDVKDNWDDEEEDKEKPEQIIAVQAKKKKSLAQIIAEKEEKRRKEMEEKMILLEQEKQDLTPQERLANRLKQQKLQEEADLQLAKETFGVTESTGSLDEINLSAKEDFDLFRRLLTEKLQKSAESPHLVSFLDDLCRDLCLNVTPDDIKKITSTLNALANEKQKAIRAKAGKKKSSKKVSLNVGRDADYMSGSIIDYDEFEDCI